MTHKPYLLFLVKVLLKHADPTVALTLHAAIAVTLTQHAQVDLGSGVVAVARPVVQSGDVAVEMVVI